MTTIVCNSCNTENQSNSLKCELCKSMLTNENSHILDEEWEDDFLFIENAELKGKVFVLSNLEEIDKVDLIIETTNVEVAQAIKEEPEFHIEPDDSVENEKGQVDTIKNPYNCSECNKCFKRKASLESHVKAAHHYSISLPSDSEPDQEYSESKTLQSFSNLKNTSEEHTILHTKPPKNYEVQKYTLATISKCDFCNESFSNCNDLEAHRIVCETKEKFYCDVCKIFVSCKNALKKHKNSRQHNFFLENPPSEENLKYVCMFCNEKFPLQILLTSHKKNHSEDIKILNDTSRIQMVDGRTTYICRICGKSSKHRTYHYEHLRVHTKEKPAKCELCGSAFSTRSSLVSHMNLHSAERPYKCHLCGESYRNRRNLKNHLVRHTGEKPFKCKYCDKTFALKYTFNDHVRLKHTGETPYECEVCKKSFKTSYILNFHRRDEHKIDTNRKPRVKILNPQNAVTK